MLTHAILTAGGGGGTRKKKHIALIDPDVFELVMIDDFQKHRALVLVEPLGRLIDMVVVTSVWTTDNLSTLVDIFLPFFLSFFLSLFKSKTGENIHMEI